MLLFFKALHVVGFVSWFAGLFYLVRIFVYHSEAAEKEEPERGILIGQFRLMEWRVYRIICNPALWITWGAGAAMIAMDLAGWAQKAYFIAGTPYWMYVKLGLLLLLTGYHYWCRRMILRLERDPALYSDWYFRLANEFPTLMLVAISFLTVLGKEGRLNYFYLAAGLVVFSGLVFWGARAYKKRRERLAAQ